MTRIPSGAAAWGTAARGTAARGTAAPSGVAALTRAAVPDIAPLVRAALLAGLAVLAAGCARSATPSALTAAELDDWLRRYERAWETKDAELAAALFAADGVYYETPYARPFEGRAEIGEYLTAATAGKDHIDYAFETLGVSGNTGIVHWTAEVVSRSAGTAIELDGIMVVEIGDAGLATSLREWWHSRDRTPLGGLPE